MNFLKNYKLVIFSIITSVTILSCGKSENYFPEIQSLSELPMTNLLKLKSNLADEPIWDEEILGEQQPESRINLPMTLALKKDTGKSIRRHEDYWEEKGGDTKISKIFQLALTTLSFFAFGGYLLTLVITAIRRNSATPGSNIIVLSSLQKYTRPKRRAFILDPVENEFDTDKYYQGMIMLSREYAIYNKK